MNVDIDDNEHDDDEDGGDDDGGMRAGPVGESEGEEAGQDGVDRHQVEEGGFIIVFPLLQFLKPSNLTWQTINELLKLISGVQNNDHEEVDKVEEGQVRLKQNLVKFNNFVKV